MPLMLMLLPAFIFALTAAPFVDAGASAPPGADPPPARLKAARPNIVFLFSDDHGWQSISAYGSYRNRTPHLDRLAEAGIRFDRCYVTNSICAPSRAVVLTGRHSHMTGHTTNERLFVASTPTLPELMQQAGYQTALIGKWHLRTEPRGFDHYDVLINQGRYYNSPTICDGAWTEHTGYVTDVLTDLAEKWLREQRDPDRPFLLMLQHKATHTPWDPAVRHLHLYDDVTIPEPPTLFDDFDGRSRAYTYAQMTVAEHIGPEALHLTTPRWMLNDDQLAAWTEAYDPANAAFEAAGLHGRELVRWKYQRFAKDYLRCVQAVDDSVGRVLAALDELDLDDNTVVIYTSDQGWYLGEHGWFDKRWMYEESARTPLIVRWPGVAPAGTVNTDLTQNLDFAQTMLDIAGAPAPAGMQGRSLVPLLRGTTPADWRKSIYYQFFENRGAHTVPRHCGVRTDRYKLIHFYELGVWEMYDLLADPGEMRSVHDDPLYADARHVLEAELARLRLEYGVTEQADIETTRHADQQQARRDFAALLGRQPARWGVTFEVLESSEHADHRLERLSYSVGGRPIEALLLIPRTAGRRHPAVLALHDAGPRARGKSSLAGPDAEPPHALDLCRRGYVVLCPDRLGYESRAAGADADRGQAAHRMLVDGASLLGLEIAEAQAALTYLERRPEVHANRIGVLGTGEGGLLAILLAFQEEELACVAALGGAASFQVLTGDGDPDRRALLTLPGLLRWGDLDRAIAGLFPRPFCMLAPDEAALPLCALARERYGDMGLSGRLRCAAFDADRSAADAAYAWLDLWLRGAAR